MAADSTRLVIELEVLLRNLNRTLRGLSQIEQRLRRVANIRIGPAQAASTQRATIAAERLALAQQRLQLQQQRLQIATQQTATAQGRAALASQRLTASQQRLADAQQRATHAARGLNVQQNHHVQAFRATEHAAGQFNRTLTALGNSLRSVGQGLTSFGATLTFSVSAPLAALTVGIVDAAVRMDSLRRGLTTIAGSSQEAAVQLERLTEIAKLPGIGFEEAIQGSIALQAVGFSAADAEKALIQFSNAVALTGGSREQLQSITVQLGQMAAQSKVLAADLKPIINAAPAVAVALRNALGTVRSEEIQELGIQSKDFIDVVIKELGKLPRATAGARNSFDNFRDTVFRAAATIGESLLPALVRLADTFGPIITGLANAFAALPAPIQSTVLVVGALVIALGPLSFIFGQLITGLGRVVVGFAQLNALGLLPTVRNFRLLGQVMVGTASLAQGAAATAALAAAGWAALGGAIIGVVALIAAIATLSTRTEEHKDSVEQQSKAVEESLRVLREQRHLLRDLELGIEKVTDRQKDLDTIYKSLNRESQGRVLLVEREKGLVRALAEEVSELIHVRVAEQRILAATVATGVTTTAGQVQTLNTQLDNAIARIEALRRQRQALAKAGPAIVRQGPIFTGGPGGSVQDSTQQIAALDEQIEKLTKETLPDLRKQSDEATESLAKQNALLLQLEESTGKSTREIFEAAKQYGLFKGDVDIAVQGVEAFRKAQISLEAALSGTTEEVIRQRLELRKLSGPADEAQKQRRLLIDAAVDFAREGSDSIDEAKKKLEEFAEKFPEVRAAIEAERKKGPIEDFLREFTGRKKAGGGRDTGVSLRAAQQQLADALVQIALAAGEREVAIEQDKNAALLQAAEVGQRLRLTSYREYLELRAILTGDSLDREIEQQEKIVAAARETQARLAREALRGDAGAAERTRRRAQSVQAEEEAIRAETRLIVLRRQRERIDSELNQAIREAQDQQLRDTIQLEIQFAELQGKIEDAMHIGVVEEFRESLEELARAQDFLNKQIEKARRLRQAERVQDLTNAQERNKRQIEGIQNIIRTRTALAELAAAEKLVENAKERQRQLEADLAFQVQFRGLSEEEAIRQRLEGERKLQASIELSASVIGDLQQRLEKLGFTSPPELQKLLNTLKTELLGLGELNFSEQFRLQEKELQRINEERLRHIQDIERAVNNRNIAEAEGLLIIRRINGEYVGDLQRQLDLLKDIAKRSGDANLQRQAQSAEETVKDASDRLADFNKQLRSTSIDALRSGFIEFFQSLRDNTISAQEKLLGLIDSVVARMNEVIAENLFDELTKSFFGDGTGGEGVIASFKRLFGIGAGRAGRIGEVAGGAVEAEALQAGAVAAAATLQTGATAAAATEAASATGFAAVVTTSATAFAAQIAAAGAAFAALIGASSTAQSLGGLGSALGGAAATGLFPAVPGGVYKVVEGGFPEAVLTTDPKHAARQYQILKAYLKETSGLGGRIKGFAAGAMITPEQIQSNLLSGFTAPPMPTSDIGNLPVITSESSMRLRQVLVDQRDLGNWVNSSEGERVLIEFLYKNQPTVRKLSGR